MALPQHALSQPLNERYNELLRQRVALEGQQAQALAEAEKARQKAQKNTRRAYLLLLLLPLLALWCRKPSLDLATHQRMVQQKDSLFTAQNALLDSTRNELEALEKLKVQQIKYVIKKGDTLEELGLLFFNDRQGGYRIGKDNNIVTKYQTHHLVKGDTLLIRFR
jgi:hypothetical protein